MGKGNTRRGGSTSGEKPKKTTDEQRTTEHQEVGGHNLGEKSLRSGTNQWERNEARPEEIRTRRTELSQRGTRGDGGGGRGWNSHRDTQHPVRANRGTGDGATRLTSGQHWDRGPAGDETQRMHSQATDLASNGMGDRAKESTPSMNRHRLERRRGMVG